MATEMKGLLGGGGGSSRRWGWTRCAVLVAALIGIALTVALMAANHVRGGTVPAAGRCVTVDRSWDGHAVPCMAAGASRVWLVCRVWC